MRIFSGSSNPNLAEAINTEVNAEIGNFPTTSGYYQALGKIYLHQFPSGESYCQFQNNIRGEDIYLIQSICHPANDNLMELLVMIDAAKRASAGRITVVTPYLGYLRQDRKDKPRVPITAKLVANLLTEAGANRVLGMDFHCEQAQGFFDIPVDHLYAMPVFAEHFKKLGIKDLVIVSPDAGGIKRASAFAEALGADFAFIAKKRISDTQVEMGNIVGDVLDKNVVILDDMTESCGTLMEAGKLCLEHGAASTRAAVSHGLFTKDGIRRLTSFDYLDEIIVTDSVPTVEQNRHMIPITVLSVASLFAKAIVCINQNKSVTELFEVKGF
jgi:ribose-phosphate pyrophosphokinase